MSSQYNEDAIIKEYFGDKSDGRFLDIGAYNPEVFSNTSELVKRGWSGVCVEASPQCFYNIQKGYEQNPNIKLVCMAMGVETGVIKFYDNGGAVATANEAHRDKWASQAPFKEIYVMCLSPTDFLKKFPGPYDFLSIDIEGNTLATLEVFPSLPLQGVKMVCVEAAGDMECNWAIRLMRKQGYAYHKQTEENILFTII